MGGEPALRALPVLRQALADPDPTIQALAAAGIGGTGRQGAPAVRDLSETLRRSRDPEVRRNCALALDHIGMTDRDDAPGPELAEDLRRFAVPALAEALKPLPGAPTRGRTTDPSEEARRYAAEALARFRYPVNEPALPAIREVIRKDPNSVVRQRCVWATFGVTDLEKYGLDRVLEKVLDEKVRDGDHQLVLYDAARALAYALRDRAPEKTADVLLHMLQNKKLLVYRKSDSTIEGTPDEDKRGKSGVRVDASGDARYMAAEALGKLGDKARKRKDVVDALREAKKDRDPTLREKSAAALKELALD
jgi:HEAT repeat protein